MVVGLFYMETNDQIMQWGGWRRGSFTNAFSNNLNTVSLKVFPSHDGRQTCKPILIYSWGLWLKGFKGRVKLSFPLVDPGLEYLYIWKVNATNRGWNLKNTFSILCLRGWEFHVKLVLFFLIFLVMTCSLMFWLWGSFKFACLWARLWEKWVNALHSELEGSCSKPH